MVLPNCQVGSCVYTRDRKLLHMYGTAVKCRNGRLEETNTAKRCNSRERITSNRWKESTLFCTVLFGKLENLLSLGNVLSWLLKKRHGSWSIRYSRQSFEIYLLQVGNTGMKLQWQKLRMCGTVFLENRPFLMPFIQHWMTGTEPSSASTLPIGKGERLLSLKRWSENQKPLFLHFSYY